MDKAEVLRFPESSEAKSGKITKWYVGEGYHVNHGQILAEIETEFSTETIESDVCGTVLYVGSEIQDHVKVDDIIMVIGDKNADVQKIIKEADNELMIKKPERYPMKGCIGEVKMFAGDKLPKKWLLCDGTKLSKCDYPILYNVLKHRYSTNEGEEFHLPKMDAINGVNFVIRVD